MTVTSSRCQARDPVLTGRDKFPTLRIVKAEFPVVNKPAGGSVMEGKTYKTENPQIGGKEGGR